MAEQQVISITTEYIKLEALLKLANLVGSGGGQGPHPGGPGLCQRGRVYHAGEEAPPRGPCHLPGAGALGAMRVCSISLDGFRNYTQFSAQFSPGVNVIWGENAQGKTNLLEAIGFLAGARSHRARGDKELIAFQRTQGTITAQVESRGRDFLIQAQLFRGARRKLFVNHVKLKTAGELSEILQTVLFCPEDLALIKAGAAERRTFLDRAICQLRPRYAEALSQYQKLLDHKTRILRDWEKNPSLLEVLEDFNEAMARAGALVIHYWAHFHPQTGGEGPDHSAGILRRRGGTGPVLPDGADGDRPLGPHGYPVRGPAGAPKQPPPGRVGGKILPLRPP